MELFRQILTFWAESNEAAEEVGVWTSIGGVAIQL
jgi:hypothetical protein